MSERQDLAYLRMAVGSAPLFSTCSKRQYYAIVTAPNGRIVGAGTNGSPPRIEHCSDGACPRAVEGAASGSNYDQCIAIHAEANALMWSDRTAREGGTLYVNGPPCWSCGKLLAGSGIKRVIHLEDPLYLDFPRVRALMEASGLQVYGLDKADL